MPSYRLLNHKGWFCFQHLFNVFNLSTFDIILDLVVGQHGPHPDDSVYTSGLRYAERRGRFSQRRSLETKELLWRGRPSKFHPSTEHDYGTNGDIELRGSPRHPTASTKGFVLLYQTCVCCNCIVYGVV